MGMLSQGRSRRLAELAMRYARQNENLTCNRLSTSTGLSAPIYCGRIRLSTRKPLDLPTISIGSLGQNARAVRRIFAYHRVL
jgi:hypothetical protein